MAAKSKEQWLSDNEELLHGDAVQYLVGMVWDAATAFAEENLRQTNNTRFTKCPKCGSDRICYWHCHDRYGCYNCDWVEALRKT